MERVAIAHVSDVHLAGLRGPDHVGSSAGDRLRVVLDAIGPMYSGVLMSGDLAAQTGSAAEYEELQLLLREFSRPVWFVSGNHDDPSRLSEAVGFRLRNGRLDYVVDHHGVRIIVLDSSRPHQIGGSLDREQIDWLDDALSLSKSSLIAIHHPSLIDGMFESRTMGLDADSVMMLRDVVDHHPVNAILSGHAHRMIVGRLADTPVVVAPSTAYEFGPLVDGRQTSRMADPQFLQHSWNSDGSGFLTMLETVSNQPWRTPD